MEKPTDSLRRQPAMDGLDWVLLIMCGLFFLGMLLLGYAQAYQAAHIAGFGTTVFGFGFVVHRFFMRRR